MEFFVMLTGLMTGAVTAALVVFGWAASERRWLAAHCRQQVAYWREEAERAKATAARLRELHAAHWCSRPGHPPGPAE